MTTAKGRGRGTRWGRRKSVRCLLDRPALSAGRFKRGELTALDPCSPPVSPFRPCRACPKFLGGELNLATAQ